MNNRLRLLATYVYTVSHAQRTYSILTALQLLPFMCALAMALFPSNFILANLLMNKYEQCQLILQHPTCLRATTVASAGLRGLKDQFLVAVSRLGVITHAVDPTFVLLDGA